MNWQPIETAPKDGTHILARLHDSNTCYVIYFGGAKQRVNPRGFWRVAWDCYKLGELDQPTHWMPLPAPPKDGE